MLLQSLPRLELSAEFDPSTGHPDYETVKKKEERILSIVDSSQRRSLGSSRHAAEEE